MREITTHRTGSDLNDNIRVSALDGPGPGGASHEYAVVLVKGTETISGTVGDTPVLLEHIIFQKGPVKESGFNGVSDEALLAILIDRLEGFQSGKFACDENERTLDHLRAALEASHQRTRARQARGVEGTHEV